jgi:flavin reductase (DIM6/NTAB) family NADH-FMN oxidoreductase RutF/pimeloyl-ACP methyl ester carboxylesterase
LGVLRFNGFGGVTLAAETFGIEGQPTVLMLPGGGQTRKVWTSAAQALADAGRHAITLDLRGHGESASSPDGRYDLDTLVQDLNSVLMQLPTRPVVVGASTGGLIALAALGEGRQELASGLVLVDAAPWLESTGLRRMAEKLSSHGAGFESIEDAAAAAQSLHPLKSSSPDLSGLSALLRKSEDGRLRWHWDPRFLQGFSVPDEDRLAKAAADIEIPTLVVHGGRSEIVSAKSMEKLVRLLKDGEIAEIEDAGHLVARDKADEFNALLLNFLERRFPRDPERYEAGSDPKTLRNALSCFGTGVTIVTTLDSKGEPVGLTANSFTSVSLDPPLILFCLSNASKHVDDFIRHKHFAINVLHIGQQPASTRFASRQANRFQSTPCKTWQTGVPIIDGSMASFECDREATYPAGDHTIFVGRVRMAEFEPRRDPLLFFRGRYRRLHFG